MSDIRKIIDFAKQQNTVAMTPLVSSVLGQKVGIYLQSKREELGNKLFQINV